MTNLAKVLPNCFSMMEKRQYFFSKIMLFGEYSLMLGSSALTVPFENYFGKWAYREDSSSNELIEESRAYLTELLDYLLRHQELVLKLDLPLFRKELEQGLYFDSNIPVAHGVGSSGALVAAVFDRYAIWQPADHIELKKTLALMESHFHGQSSGIDPLSCYVGKPLLIRGLNSLPIEMNIKVHGSQMGMFLLNTKITGKTGPLVDYFKQQLTHYGFFKKVRDVMIAETNNCVDAILMEQDEEFYKSLYKLSEFQYQYLNPMIPDTFLPLWKRGLEQGEYLLKLCGSGGGGFLLGFARHEKPAFKDAELVWIE